MPGRRVREGTSEAGDKPPPYIGATSGATEPAGAAAGGHRPGT
jgi:hypothetical protein